MNQKENQSRMISMSAKMDTILKIFGGFCLAGAIVAAIFIPLTFIFGDGIVADAASIELGSVKLELAEGAIPEFAQLRPMILLGLISAVIMCLILWYGVKVIRGIIAPMKEGKPFDESVPAGLRKLGVLVLIGGTALQVLNAVSTSVSLRVYDIENLVNTAAVKSVEMNLDFHAGYIILAAVLFLLSTIFRYGQQLQQESDETL